jgi:hypothetical protein
MRYFRSRATEPPMYANDYFWALQMRVLPQLTLLRDLSIYVPQVAFSTTSALSSIVSEHRQ